MEPKTLKQFLAEKRKADAQRPEVVMKTLETLTNVKDGSYYASGRYHQHHRPRRKRSGRRGYQRRAVGRPSRCARGGVSPDADG